MFEPCVGDLRPSDRKKLEGWQPCEMRHALVVDVRLPQVEPFEFLQLGEVGQASAGQGGAFQGEIGQVLEAGHEFEVVVLEIGGAIELYLSRHFGLVFSKDSSAQRSDRFLGRDGGRGRFRILGLCRARKSDARQHELERSLQDVHWGEYFADDAVKQETSAGEDTRKNKARAGSTRS